jgi:hypothetical protein
MFAVIYLQVYMLLWYGAVQALCQPLQSTAADPTWKVGVTVSFLCLQFYQLGCLLGVAVAQGTWPRVRSGSPEYHTAMTRCRLAQRGAAVFSLRVRPPSR